uniref:Uncharacterized protein n=1 Tax=Cannabis sativa TaxID=3483 RepID=A0A803R0W7_CANSA
MDDTEGGLFDWIFSTLFCKLRMYFCFSKFSNLSRIFSIPIFLSLSIKLKLDKNFLTLVLYCSSTLSLRASYSISSKRSSASSTAS